MLYVLNFCSLLLKKLNHLWLFHEITFVSLNHITACFFKQAIRTNILAMSKTLLILQDLKFGLNYDCNREIIFLKLNLRISIARTCFGHKPNSPAGFYGLCSALYFWTIFSTKKLLDKESTEQLCSSRHSGHVQGWLFWDTSLRHSSQKLCPQCVVLTGDR